MINRSVCMYVKEPKKINTIPFIGYNFRLKTLIDMTSLLSSKNCDPHTYIKEENRRKSISLLSKNRRNKVDPTGTIKC